MIRISVIYPLEAGARFDHDYYRDRHMPFVCEQLGSACLSYAIDRGLSAGLDGGDPPFVAMCHIFSPSLEAYRAAMVSSGAAIRADVIAYTDIVPIRQISEVIVADGVGPVHSVGDATPDARTQVASR